ncbi:CDP-alcohol phosphatidyltransferase family protein [Planosporangium mesophilum]|uniref:CDP-alcohol phosphatidyltransferase family protein n=1 Tax=Planosporangium mesophilum TaxID=689768 RepID=UPI00143AE2EE|nr:CDP-alcohol phosphatidyltransferase family protein [Planosporangium mesophilum]NJC84794.1 CDP-alcohol phosphatidyltransferase [Planosporangium mesophilum]
MRRSGSLARQVLLVGRPGHRRTESASGATTLILPEHRAADGRRTGQVRLRRRARTVSVAPAIAPAASVVLPAASVVAPAVVVPAAAAVALQSPESSPASAAPADGLAIPLLPGDPTLARRIRFVLVNACTVGSLVLGMSAIFLAVNGVSAKWAALCLIACVAFDGLDGALARKLGVSSPFGAQMDSLADMCSFGIAAPVVVYAWLGGSAPAWLAVPACALVAVCAAIRLARFNVSPKDGRFFCGVPTTMVAAVLALGTLIEPAIPASVRVGVVALLALAMVSSFPYAKLARLLRLPPWLLVLPVVSALIDYRLTFAGIVMAYLVSGPLVWLRQRSA